MRKGRVAIFLSGRGSNFVAIYNSSLKPDSNFRIVVVISDKKKALGLEKAREFNIPAYHVSVSVAKSRLPLQLSPLAFSPGESVRPGTGNDAAFKSMVFKHHFNHCSTSTEPPLSGHALPA